MEKIAIDEMNIDPIPVWKFFEIPDNAVELCLQLAKEKPAASNESNFWHRAAEFLENVKSQTANQLEERDFDWILKLRVLFEKDEEIAQVRSRMDK